MDASFPASRVPGLLFWQYCVLAALCGVACCKAPFFGLSCGLVLLLLQAKAWKRVLMLVLCLLGGFGLGAWSAPAAAPQAPLWLDSSAALRIEGRVVSVSGQPDRRLRILLEDVRPADAPDLPPLQGKVNWTWDQGSLPDLPRPLPGQTVRLNSKIRPVSGFGNFGLSNFADYWAERGIYYTAWTLDDKGQVEISGQGGRFAQLRESWRGAMVHALGGNGAALTRFQDRNREIGCDDNEKDWPADFPPALHRPMSQGRAMLPALIFGDRYGLDSQTQNLFSRSSLVHSLALSGQHLALAGSVAALLVWLLSWGRGGILLRLPRRAWVLTLGLPFAALYLWIGNAPPSLVRAALMMLFGALLWLGKRPTTLLDLLFFAALCFLLAWPRAVFDLSVQLSVLSVAGIALALPWLRKLNNAIRAALPAPVAAPCAWAALLLGTSLAVQIATLPLVLLIFGRITPLFVLNLLWLPVLGTLVLPLAALGLFFLLILGPQFFSQSLFLVAALPGDLLLLLLQSMQDQQLLPMLQGLKSSGLSAAGYACAVAALACLTGRRSSRNSRILLLCACLLLPLGALEREADMLLARLQQRVCLRMLDVGQGQALVLEWPGGRMLLDAGGMFSPRMDSGRDIVAHALSLNRPPRLELAAISHGDLDHARGMAAILELFKVEKFLHSAYPLKASPDRDKLERLRQEKAVPLRELQAGDLLNLGRGLSLQVLHPPAAGRFSSNNASLILRLSRNGKGLALLCGDAEIPTLRRLLAEGHDLSAEVLLIPHHGSAKSLFPEFYDAVQPRLALISCGAYNSFGFPRPEVLAALAERDIECLSSANSGEVRLVWTGEKSYTITKYR